MDKVAIYKEHIMEKAASRAWKAHIGELGEEAINKLKNSNILNHEKELAGLEKGTDNIIKHHGGITGHFSPDETAHIVGKEVDANGSIQKQLNLGGATKEDYLDEAKDMHRMNNGFYTTGPKTRAVVKGKLEEGNDLSEAMKGLPKSDFNKRYMEGILNRHEADELRFTMNSLKGKKNNILIGGEKTPAGQYSSHISPKVLGSESTHAAVAPSEVKDKMNNLRSDEMWGINKRGLNYGASGKYNKQLNARMQRKEVAENKPMFDYLKD